MTLSLKSSKCGMLTRHLLKSWTAKAGLGPHVAINRSVSTSPVACSSSKVYELRMYTIQAQHFGPTLQLFEKHADLRLQYSKLFGYWTAEIGGGSPTQLVHIWEYDSLSHRREVRNQLAGDDQWKTQFLSTLLKNLASWRNDLMVASPDTAIKTDFDRSASAVYLLETAKKTKDQNDLADASYGDHIVGKFQGILGPTGVEYTLWRFGDVDEATACARKRGPTDTADGTMMLLYPTSFSPIH